MTKATEHSSWAEYKKSRKKANASSGHPISTSTQATKATGVPGTWAEYKAARQSGQIERGVQPQSSIQERIRSALNEGATSPVSSRNIGAGENILPSTKRVGAGESVRGYVGQGEYAAQMMPEDFVGPLNDRQTRRDIIRDEEYMRNAREKRSVAEELFDKFGRESINANLPETSMPAEYTRSSAARQTAEMGLPDFNQPRGQMQLMQDPYSAPVSGGIAPGQVLTQRAGITPEMTRAKQQGLRAGAGEAVRMDPVEIGYENLSAQPDFAEYANQPIIVPPEKHYEQSDGSVNMWHVEHMTDDQKAKYNYLAHKYGFDEADKYYRTIEEEVNERMARDVVQSIERLPPVVEQVAKGSYALGAGLGRAVEGYKTMPAAVRGDTTVAPKSQGQYGFEMMREDMGFLGRLGMDLAQNVGNQVPQMLFSAIAGGLPITQIAQMVLAGLNTATTVLGSTYAESIRSGKTPDVARRDAILSATIETLTEAIGGNRFLSAGTLTDARVDKIVGAIDGAFGRFAARTGFDAFGEAGEELVAGLLEPLIKRLAFGEDESVDWDEVAYSTLLGGLAGVGMGAPVNIMTGVQEQQQKAIEGAAQSIKSAETTPEQKHGAAAAALEAGGVMKEAAQEIADSVVKMANGQTVTQDELQMIAETPGALEVVETVVGAETDFAVDNYDDIEVPEDVADVDAYVNRERAVRDAVQLGSERAISEEIYDMGEGQDAAKYTEEYERAYNRGRNNMPMSDEIAGTYKTLTAEQTRAAWNEGSKAYRAEQQRKPVQAAESMNGRKGYIDTSAIKNTRLTADQSSAVRASRYVAEALGIKVVWYASQANAEGKRTEANGFFDPKDRSIHLDVYAGVNTAENAGAYRYAAMRTFSHELTHYIEDQSPAMYGKLRDMVFAHLAGKGIDVESLIDEKAQRSPGISRFEATQEVVADACEMMLRDSKAVKAAAMRDASLWQKIKERFAKFVEDLRAAFERVEAVHKEAKGLMQDVEGVLKYTEDLQKAWDDALVDATRNARSAGRDTNVRSKAAEQTNRGIERIEEKGGSLVLSKEKADALNKKATGKAGVTIVGDTLPTVQGRRQRAFLEALGREYGIEFVVHPTIDKGALNGVYISGNRIHLAADNLEGGLMQTGIHESVHLIRAAEGEGYTELLDNVRGALGADFDWDGTVAARAETDGLDLDAAEEEVLAEAVSAIYTNESAMRAFVMKHQSLAQRLIDGLRNFVAKMREIAERIYGRTGHEEINAMINATDEAVQKAADAYERALAEWKERAKAINYEGREPKATTPKANKSTLSTWAMALRQSAEKTGNPEVIARTEQAIANVQDFVDKAKEDSLAWKYLSSGTLNPYAPKGRSEGLGPLRTNVEYIYSFDPDTSCFRADGYIKIRDNIQRRMGRKMTARETQNLIQLMTAYGQMIPCRYCYVYGKRYMLDSAYNKKIFEKLGEGGVETVFKAAESARRQIFEYLDEHYDVNNRYTLDEEMQVREFVLPTKRKKVRGVEKEVMMTPDDFIRDLRRHFKLESRRNLNTFLKGMVGEWLDDVFNGTSHNYDELADYVEMDTETLDIHATAVAGAQGGVKANKAKKYIPYDHQLDRIADDDMWNIIAHDGIRFQSSTDFRIEYVLDYMQLIAQMATYDKDLLVGATPVLAKNGMRTGKFVPGTGRIEHVSGLPGHMYAKNPAAAYILAPSGLHINASVAFDGDRLGQIKENTAEGMPMEDVEKLVTKYDNVGGMAMVTNPAQLAHAMKLVREGKLHQIIPFHASGLAREYYYDMMAWQDYTSVQNESLYTSAYCAEQLRKAGKEPAGTAEEIFKQYEDMFGEAEKLYVRNPKTGAYIRKAPHFLPGESVFEGVDPKTGEAKVTRIPGHNNDYDTYLRLCEEWQVHPRFYEVEIPTEDGGTMKAIDDKVGYMALIYESRPGTKKAPVTADFDIEYALDQLSKRAAQDDKYAQGYLAAYEQGTDREDAIRRGRQYEKIQIYDPMGIEKRFFSEGLHEDDKHDKGLLTPDVVAMRESNGIKIDPKKNVQLSEEAMDAYNLVWRKENGIRNSARDDSTVNSAAFRKWFGNSKIVNPDGTPKVLYHQTNAEFTVFDTQRQGAGYYDSEMPSGIFMKETPDTIKLGMDFENSRQAPLFVRMEKPLYLVDREQANKYWKKYVPDYAQMQSELDDLNAKYEAEFDKADKISEEDTDEAWEKWDAETARVLEEWRAAENGKRRQMKEAIDAWLEDSQYDGIVMTRDKGTGGTVKTYVVLKNTQVKSATDNNGEYSTENADIRYQPREEEYVSNREILANALEGTAHSVAEKNRLAEYRMRIRSLDIAQNRVSNIREEIIEVYKMIKEAKGAEKKQLTERLKNLHAQKNTLEREMNETDKVLLELEATEPLKLVVFRERKVAMAKGRAKAEDRRSRDKYRERIAKKVAALTVQLTKPTTKRYIPDPIRGPVADFVASVRFTSRRQLKGGAPTQKDMRLAESLAALQRVMLNIKSKQNENTADAVQNGFGMYLDLPEGFIETLTTLADQVAKAAQHSPEGYNVNKMSTAQLKALDAIITSLNASIQNVNKFLSENLYRHIDDAARDTIWDLEQIRAREKSTKIGQFLEWENALPVYAFDRLGRGGQAIFKGLMRGQDKLAKNADQVIKYAESVYDEEELKAWEEDVREFTFNEETIRIPVAHIMSLYCLMRREQAMGHLHGEGFRVGDYTIKGTTYKDKGHVTSDKMMAEIVSVLSDRQKMVADKLQMHMSTVGAEWGNYVSMRRFGYQAFGEITYFPIESDSRHLSAVNEDGGKGNPLYALLNIGPVQELTPKANNRLVLHSIFDVYSKHMSEMAQYNALALPLLDAIKWLNYRETTNLPGDEKATKRTLSIQDVIVNAYGMQGRGYVIRMLEDISGRKATVDEDKTFGKMLGRMNRAQVAFNLRVALLQPLSLFRAAMTLNAVPTMQGVLRNIRNLQDNIEEMEQHSGIAKWKALGFREVNVSRGVQKLIKHDYKATDKIVEKTMAAAEAMDKLTWSAIWEVCKIQTAKSMNPDDERYMEAVRDLFEETIYRTQVVDSVLTKTQYMRSPAGMNKWLSSFMSEPSTTYNMLADAVWKVADDARVSNVQEALRKNAPRIRRTVGVYAMSAVATTLIEGLMSAWRDDDDYEKFIEQMFDGFWWNLFENMNPLSMLPIGSQLWEGTKTVLENRGFDVYGYDMSNPINETFQSVIGIFDAWDRYAKGSGTGYNVLYKSGQMLSSLSGLPFANAMREVTSLWNNAIASWNPQLRIQTYKTPDAKGTAAYIKAVRSSNDRLAAEMIEELEANGVTGEAREKAMTSAIKEAYLTGGMDDKEAARMLEKHAGYADTADDKMAAERLVREWTVKNETGESSQYARVWGYISDWDGRALLKEINELRKMGVKDSSIRSSVQSHFKGIYLEATGSEKSKLRQHLIAAFTYMGMTDKEAKAKIDEWDKQNRN